MKKFYNYPKNIIWQHFKIWICCKIINTKCVCMPFELYDNANINNYSYHICTLSWQSLLSDDIIDRKSSEKPQYLKNN